MRTDFETITPERVDEHVLLLWFDRPHRANAMNTQMGLDLRELFQDLYVDQEGLRCVVVTGRGEKAFSAGGDLKDRDGMTDAQWQHQHAIYEQMVRHMRDCPIPIIGAVNGAAYGGGCELTLLTDFAYAARTARFALTEITLGIMPGTTMRQKGRASARFESMGRLGSRSTRSLPWMMCEGSAVSRLDASRKRLISLPSVFSSGKYFWFCCMVRIRHSCGTSRYSASNWPA